jgi:hypothetical protein
MSGEGYVYLMEWRYTDDGWEVWAFDHWLDVMDSNPERKVVAVFLTYELTNRQLKCAVNNTLRATDYCKCPKGSSWAINS